MLLGEAVEGGGPREVTRDDLPGAQGAEEPMAVHAISDLVNVNALADGETLPFEPQGINIVYGKNGGGKTGYSRILKHAGRTLHPEAILTNIAEDGDEDRVKPNGRWQPPAKPSLTSRLSVRPMATSSAAWEPIPRSLAVAFSTGSIVRKRSSLACAPAKAWRAGGASRTRPAPRGGARPPRCFA